MTTPRDPIYAGHRYPAEIISYAVWLYFRFPLSLRMVEEMLAARGISVTHETIRQSGLKFGREFANRIRRRAPCRGDKWHLDEVVISFAGKKHWLWRAVDQDGFVLDVLVQSRRDKEAAKRLFRKLLKKQGRAPRVLVTEKLKSYAAEFASERTSPRHEPRTMRLFRWGHQPFVEIWSRDGGSLARYGANSDLRVMRLRPFPKPARTTIHRDTHDCHPFFNLQNVIYGDDFNSWQTKFCDWQRNLLKTSL
jgi:transposase-like protein